jgi:hypothetical protein
VTVENEIGYRSRFASSRTSAGRRPRRREAAFGDPSAIGAIASYIILVASRNAKVADFQSGTIGDIVACVTVDQRLLIREAASGWFSESKRKATDAH